MRIRLVHRAAVEALFEQAGVPPIFTDVRADGTISFWFGKGQVAALANSGVLDQIPLDCWAGHAIAGEPPVRG